MRALGPTDADFGVVVFTPPHLLRLARATCASVRWFMEDTPICLFVDGPDRAEGFDEWGVRVVHTHEVEHEALRDLCFGTYRAKVSSFWVAPYDRFLYLDVDTVVWGDMRRYLADLDEFDVVLDQPHPVRTITRELHTLYYVLNAERVGERFPEFDAARHVPDYANTGVFFARRGAVDLDEALEVVRFAVEAPQAFFWDQGILNLLLFRASDRGELRLKQRQLQVVGFAEDVDDLRRRFRIEHGAPVAEDDPVVLHWAGLSKPRLGGEWNDHFAPAHFFRRRFLRGPAAQRSRVRAELALLREDVGPVLAVQRRRLRHWRRSQQRRAYLAARRRLRGH